MRRGLRACGLALTVALACALWGPSDAMAADAQSTAREGASDQPDLRVGTSGLPVPRYVSLGAHEVNMRSGPGTRYPIKWVYTRKGLPMRVEAEFDIWRKVRDRDGEVGWVHGSLLSGRRNVIVAGEGPEGTQTLLEKPHPASDPVLRAEDGVIGELLECSQGWCRIRIDGKRGWVPEMGLWGVQASDRKP